MNLVGDVVRNKLAVALGMAVDFDAFKTSLLAGSIDIANLRIGGDGAALPPLLQADRTLARISLGRALKKEIAVRTLTIERPVVRIVRRPTGHTNAGIAATKGAPADDADSRWTFDCEKVLLVDGQFHLEWQGPRPLQLSATGVLAQLERAAADRYSLTLIAQRVRLIEPELSLGEFKASGAIDGAADLSAIARAALRADFSLGTLLRGHVQSPGIGSRHARGMIEGIADAALLAALLPREFLSPATAGRLEFRVEARHDPDATLHITEAIVRATDLALGGAPWLSPRSRGQ